MKIVTVSSNSQVVLFTETKKNDFTFNHVLFIIPDIDDPEQIQLINKYKLLPEETLISDRKCIIKGLNIK